MKLFGLIIIFLTTVVLSQDSTSSQTTTKETPQVEQPTVPPPDTLTPDPAKKPEIPPAAQPTPTPAPDSNAAQKSKKATTSDVPAVKATPEIQSDPAANDMTPSEPETSTSAKEPKKPEPSPGQQPTPSEKKTAPPASSQTPPQKDAKAQPQSSPDKPSDKKTEDAPGSGLKIKPGLTFGTMTRNGKTWTRFSFRPEISIGKLGVALDLELFMNEKQEFDSYGWDFDTFDNGMESVMRKIYYVRWGHPGDGLYLKAGSLEGVTLGYGLVMNDYGNIAFYPDKKLIGFHGQLNHLPILDLNLEVVLNNYQELFNGEGVVGTRLSVAPIASLPLPIVKNLRFGASIVSDLNQLGALPDRDGDNCPDPIDINPNNKRQCKLSNLIDPDDFDPDATIKEAKSIHQARDSSLSADIKNSYKNGDQFSLMSFDAGLPIIDTKLLTLEVYSEIAFQMFQNSDDIFDGGYGIIFPGVRSKIGPLSGSLEYRVFQQPFYPGHFNAWYEAERAVVSDGDILTKEAKYWADSLTGLDQGIYGSAGLDLKGLATVGGSYKVMFPDAGGHVQGYTGSAALGQSITNLIPKLSSGSIFWHKERVGDDLNSDGDPGSSDGFFEPNIYTYYGYSVGIQMGANMTITVQRITTHTRSESGSLTKATNMSFETAVSF